MSRTIRIIRKHSSRFTKGGDTLVNCSSIRARKLKPYSTGFWKFTREEHEVYSENIKGVWFNSNTSSQKLEIKNANRSLKKGLRQKYKSEIRKEINNLTMEYKILVKTDSYTGNFERDYCAHVTGCIGECEVGKEMVDNKLTDKFDPIIKAKSDDHGCYRPVSVGDNSNDLEIYFYEKPSDKLISIIKERSKTFNESMLIRNKWYKQYPTTYNPVNFLEFKLIESSIIETIYDK